MIRRMNKNKLKEKGKNELKKLRVKIDRTDKNIIRELHKRWVISGKLKQIKKRYGIKIVEDSRLKEMKNKHIAVAKKYSVPDMVVMAIFKVIVNESIKHQKGK